MAMLAGSNQGTPKRQRPYDNTEHTFQKRPKPSLAPQKEPAVFVVHRVTCRQDRHEGEDHSDHFEDAYYYDVPRLLRGDSRGSALRGQSLIRDFEGFWDEHPEVHFLVVKTYSCDNYHFMLHDSFELAVPYLERKAFNRLRPWIYRLSSDGPLAVFLSERIMISTEFSDAMSKLVKSNEPDFGKWEPEDCLVEPYDYFFHFRRRLRQDGISKLDPRTGKELGLLLDYVEGTQRAQFDEVERIFGSGLVRQDVFSKVFIPYELVVIIQDGQPRALLAETVSLTEQETIVLECSAWSFDGSFRKEHRTLEVVWPSPKSSQVPLDSLSVWPLRLDRTGLEGRLQRRGQKFWSYRHRELVSYNAPTPTIFEMQVTNPKYMIDYKTYRKIYPQNFTEDMATEEDMKEEGINMTEEKPPSDLFCKLLPPTMIGYAFHDKKWRSLFLDHVGPVVWNKKAFDRLVLKHNKSKTIKALVTTHLKKVQNFDVVENKGNGLIILLHGPPGTGKTLTAESVAEFAEKPLYRVTCGDIGTEAESVERYMDSVLLLGTIWECVVLLDEADVFLEERQVTDLARNALVSVFLRILEYYEGILILTTNRVGTFDEAFKSRIQLPIHYPALDEEGRHEIWLNFLKDLRAKKIDMNFEQLKSKVDRLARFPFNGRQIRNSLWNATQIAKYEREPLNYHHLEQVVDILGEFEDYLKETHGLTDEENAKAQRVRSR